MAKRLVVDLISWFSILAPLTHPLSYFGKRLKYINIGSFCIKSFFSLGRFVYLQIRKVWSMLGFGFEFGYGPLRSNFWIVPNSVRQYLASLEFVLIFLKIQTWALVFTYQYTYFQKNLIAKSFCANVGDKESDFAYNN